jgi:hypothetical protein
MRDEVGKNEKSWRSETESPMNSRIVFRVAGIAMIFMLVASPSPAYIHFPPMTMPKMCKDSMSIRVLGVTRFDREKGVVVYEVLEQLKGQKPRNMSFRHVIRKDADGVKPILDWVDKKQAVMFTIEAGGIGCGYVFIDKYCYSVDYNRSGDYWLLIRAEPNMSACYYGSAEKLHTLAKEILDGKEVQVPVNELIGSPSKDEKAKRAQDVTDVLNENRGVKPEK